MSKKRDFAGLTVAADPVATESHERELPLLPQGTAHYIYDTDGHLIAGTQHLAETGGLPRTMDAGADLDQTFDGGETPGGLITGRVRRARKGDCTGRHDPGMPSAPFIRCPSTVPHVMPRHGNALIRKSSAACYRKR